MRHTSRPALVLSPYLVSLLAQGNSTFLKPAEQTHPFPHVTANRRNSVSHRDCPVDVAGGYPRDSRRSLEPGGVAASSSEFLKAGACPNSAERLGESHSVQPRAVSPVTFRLFKSVIVTPAVYLRLVEFLHVNVQSTGQKSHCVKTLSGHHKALFLLNS